jgi:hypothetical protein
LDKRSSLFCRRINDDEEKFYNLDPSMLGVPDVTLHSFSSSRMKQVGKGLPKLNAVDVSHFISSTFYFMMTASRMTLDKMAFS